jgi:hypothetical protein
MNRVYFPLLVCISLLQGCSESCKSISFESWGVVDTVVMRLPGERAKRTLTDPVVIQEIRAFVEARKDRWEVPWPDTPIPPMALDLYEGKRNQPSWDWYDLHRSTGMRLCCIPQNYLGGAARDLKDIGLA